MNNACYGVTRDPNENDYLLVFDFEKVTWKYKIDEFINKLQNILNNKLINENDLSIIITNSSNELLETLKVIENCTNCKDEKIDGNYLDKCLAKLEKEEQEEEKEDIIYELNDELNKIDFGLNKKVLCESCKGKKFEKLTDKYGNEEIARFLYYQCKLNATNYYSNYIRWIPFDEFKNIEYLAKGDFGEVHKATWINGYYYYYYYYYYYDDDDDDDDDDEVEVGNKDIEVVLKRIYNNSSDDKIVDILKEVKFIIIIIKH